MSQTLRVKRVLGISCIIFLIPAFAIADARDIGSVYSIFGSQGTAQTQKPRSPAFAAPGEEEVQGQERVEPLETAPPELARPTRPIQPLVPEKSVIEELFSGRIPPADVPLTQFGYAFFRPLEELPLYSLPVTADYALGPGDELVLYVWGDVFEIFETNFEPMFSLSVDRDGKVFIPRIGVFHVWGASLGEVEKIVQRTLDAKVKGAHAKVTVGRLRVLPVYLVGEVNQPGQVLVNGLSTVIDALSLGAGIKKTGSLRNISVKRKQKGTIEEIRIDLYDLFIQGMPS